MADLNLWQKKERKKLRNNSDSRIKQFDVSQVFCDTANSVQRCLIHDQENVRNSSVDYWTTLNHKVSMDRFSITGKDVFVEECQALDRFSYSGEENSSYKNAESLVQMQYRHFVRFLHSFSILFVLSFLWICQLSFLNFRNPHFSSPKHSFSI